MVKKRQLGLIVLLSLIFGIYPVTYFLTDLGSNDFLFTKSISTLSNFNWNLIFRIHIIASGISITIGWSQFVKTLKGNRPKLHRYLGYLYFTCITIGGLTGLYLAVYSNTILSQAGFIVLSLLWLSSSFIALYYVKRKQFGLHKKWALRSYSLTFSAVTFRFLLITLDSVLENYELSFGISSWLCWIINLTVIESIIRNRNKVNYGIQTQLAQAKDK